MQPKVFLTGNLARDPELTTTPNGVSVAKFDVACNYGFGEEKKTDYFHIVVWRSVAENCAKYLKKGSKVAIEGGLSTRSYKNQAGETKYITEITAQEVEFLTTPKAEKEETQDEPVVSHKKVRQPTLTEFESNDLPF